MISALRLSTSSRDCSDVVRVTVCRVTMCRPPLNLQVLHDATTISKEENPEQ
jgi:hypothetical protein